MQIKKYRVKTTVLKIALVSDSDWDVKAIHQFYRNVKFLYGKCLIQLNLEKRVELCITR